MAGQNKTSLEKKFFLKQEINKLVIAAPNFLNVRANGQTSPLCLRVVDKRKYTALVCMKRVFSTKAGLEPVFVAHYCFTERCGFSKKKL